MKINILPSLLCHNTKAHSPNALPEKKRPESLPKKQRHYLTTKVHIIKTIYFSVVMYGCESWTIKKAECQIIGAFKLLCWRRLLRVAWKARRSNQSIPKEINPDCSLEGLTLKLKLQYFAPWGEEPTIQKRYWCWERLRVRGEGNNREQDGLMASPTQWTWVWTCSGRWWRTGKPGVLQSMGFQRVGHNWACEQQQLPQESQQDQSHRSKEPLWPPARRERQGA